MKRFDMADWAEQLLGNMVKANERAAAAMAAERSKREEIQSGPEHVGPCRRDSTR